MRLLHSAFILTLLVGFAAPTQAAIINFNILGKAGAGLLPGNEASLTNASTGSGGETGAGVFYDDATMLLTINVAWGSLNSFSDLNAAATASHLHGSDGIGLTGNAGVLITLARADSTANNGSISTTTTALSAANESLLLAGDTYINIHTSSNSGGELRGNLIAVPEPGSVAALALLAGGAIIRRRRV